MGVNEIHTKFGANTQEMIQWREKRDCRQWICIHLAVNGVTAFFLDFFKKIAKTIAFRRKPISHSKNGTGEVYDDTLFRILYISHRMVFIHRTKSTYKHSICKKRWDVSHLSEMNRIRLYVCIIQNDSKSLASLVHHLWTSINHFANCVTAKSVEIDNENVHKQYSQLFNRTIISIKTAGRNWDGIFSIWFFSVFVLIFSNTLFCCFCASWPWISVKLRNSSTMWSPHSFIQNTDLFYCVTIIVSIPIEIISKWNRCRITCPKQLESDCVSFLDSRGNSIASVKVYVFNASKFSKLMDSFTCNEM